jgi:hypothetical protein
MSEVTINLPQIQRIAAEISVASEASSTITMPVLDASSEVSVQITV